MYAWVRLRCRVETASRYADCAPSRAYAGPCATKAHALETKLQRGVERLRFATALDVIFDADRPDIHAPWSEHCDEFGLSSLWACRVPRLRLLRRSNKRCSLMMKAPGDAARRCTSFLNTLPACPDTLAEKDQHKVLFMLQR